MSTAELQDLKAMFAPVNTSDADDLVERAKSESRSDDH